MLIGAGQVIQRPGVADPREPVALAIEALRLAAGDSGAGEGLLRRADSVRHVATLSWPYRDEARLIAAELGATPRETVRTTTFGGDGPQRLVGATAQAIAAGEVDVALISGGEAPVALRAGAERRWPQQGEEVRPSFVLGADRAPSNEAEIAVGLVAPIYNYALLETAVRGRSGARPAEHSLAVARLWSGFSEVAATNPYAWLPRAHPPADLVTPGVENRPISAPYLKLQTANLQVDLASGLILCSAEAAAAAGVPRDRWVFVHAAAHAHDEWFLSERAELSASPAVRACGAAALEHAGVHIDEVAQVDLYSCFPSAVQIAAAELGLQLGDPARPLTVTGGLTFAGGPGNNYSAHAIATMASRLRADPGSFGLVSALGWYVTKHAVGVYSTAPPARPFREIDAGPAAEAPPARRARTDFRGAAPIEAYTVPYGRDGEPEAAIVTALAADGARALARSGDPATAAALLEGDPLGREVEFDGAGSFA